MGLPTANELHRPRQRKAAVTVSARQAVRPLRPVVAFAGMRVTLSSPDAGDPET